MTASTNPDLGSLPERLDSEADACIRWGVGRAAAIAMSSIPLVDAVPLVTDLVRPDENRCCHYRPSRNLSPPQRHRPTLGATVDRPDEGIDANRL
jgi:hypothetical protein